MKRSVQRILASTLTLGALMLLAGCPSSDHSSSGDSRALPLAYTGKTEAADLSNVTPDEQQQLSETATRLVGNAWHATAFSPLFPFLFDNAPIYETVVDQIMTNSDVMDTATSLPQTQQTLLNPSPCTEPQDNITYQAYNNSNRYALVTFNETCVELDYRVPPVVRDAFNAWTASQPTIAIGLAVLGLPSHISDPFVMGEGIVNGSMIVDRQLSNVLPDGLTVEFRTEHYTAPPVSLHAEYKTSIFSYNFSRLFPCHGDVCMAPPEWFAIADGGLLTLKPPTPVASPYCADPAGRDISCTDNDVLNAFTNAPYPALGEPNPPFNGKYVIYDPTFGAVNISTNQPLQPCTADMPATPESPFQSGSIAITGGTGAFDVTYTGCGQAPVISPHT